MIIKRIFSHCFLFSYSIYKLPLFFYNATIYRFYHPINVAILYLYQCLDCMLCITGIKFALLNHETFVFFIIFFYDNIFNSTKLLVRKYCRKKRFQLVRINSFFARLILKFFNILHYNMR